MTPGDEIELDAEALAYGGGDTTGHAPDGRVVFTPLLAPGDHAKVRITEVRATFARAHPVELVRPGPDRVRPPCEVFGVCGGCQWQHVSLGAQRDAKVRILRHLLEPLGVAGAVAPLRGTGNGYHYRNRLILPVRAGRNGLRAGFFRADSHDLVDVPTCLVQSPQLWDAAVTALGLAMQAGVTGYNERLDKGCLRHLLVRETATGELGVVYVTGTPAFAAGEALARELMRRKPRIAGVAQNVNPGRTNVVLGPETRVLGGRGWLRERVGALELRASLPAFFQANHAVTEIMAGLVGEWTGGVTGGLLDLYTGVGVLGLTAAAGCRASWLAGIEESAAAVEDARVNAAALYAAATPVVSEPAVAAAEGVRAAAVPGVPSEWHAGGVEAILPGLAARLGAPGCVIADPPRKGLSPEALAAVIALRSPLFVYISCDPATFARDLKGLLAAGYRLETAVPLDMFPQTWHIELAARLTMNE